MKDVIKKNKSLVYGIVLLMFGMYFTFIGSNINTNNIQFRDDSLENNVNCENLKDENPIIEDESSNKIDEDYVVENESVNMTGETYYDETITEEELNKELEQGIQPRIDSSNINYKIDTSVKNLEIYFPNTQNDGTNETILLKTKTGEVLLIDTASNSDKNYNEIIRNIKRVSNKDNNGKYILNYLILSHSHPDHVGNLEKILKSDELSVKNVIYKNEKFGSKYNKKSVKDIITSHKNSGYNIIETSTLVNNATVSSHSEISLGDGTVKLILFNITDVFKDKTTNECYNSSKYQITEFSSNINLSDNRVIKTVSGKYGRLANLHRKGKNSEVMYMVYGNDLGKEYYYQYNHRTTSLKCNPNSNSIAVLIEVNTLENGAAKKKYAYFPSDLSNNGYSFFGDDNKTFEKYGITRIYGDGTSYAYQADSRGKLELDSNGMPVKLKSFKPVKAASETRTAINIRKYIGDANLGNIVFYQESHHGMANAYDAMNVLGLNRNDLYTIRLSKTKGSSGFALIEMGYYKSLSNVNKRLASGATDKNGIRCTITDTGVSRCVYISK